MTLFFCLLWRLAFAADTTPPTGSIKINNGAASTSSINVTLNLSARDTGSGVAQMKFSNNNSTWTTAEPYSITKSWTLTSGSGTKTVYVKFKDAAGNWSTAYSDTILFPNQSPQINTITPASGTSTPQQAVTFATTYTDPNGWQDIQYVYFQINTSTGGKNCFYGYYNQNTNLLYLRNDANTSWLGGFNPGSAKVIENSYAKLDCSKTTVTGSGNTLTVNWSVTFKSAFLGTKNCYLYVKDDANAYKGWTQKGTWTIQTDTNETEPNNSFTQANLISLDNTITGTINPTGDQDYYKVHTDIPGMLSVAVTNVPSNINLGMNIYNSSQSPLKSGNSSAGQDLTLSAELPSAGDYYIFCWDYGNDASSTSPYSLKATLAASIDPYEPNNNFSAAKSINIGESIQATIFARGDQDYYKVHTDIPGMLSVAVTNVPSNINLGMNIYNSSQSPLKSGNSSAGQDLTLSAELPSAGDYYIFCWDYGNDASSTSPYSLKAIFSDVWVKNFSDSPDPFSPNNDSKKDTTTITATFSEEVSWTITIKDSQLNLIRTFIGTGKSLSQIWDGKNSQGAPVGGGIYTYQIGAAAHGSTAFPMEGAITIDNTFPAANISLPLGGATLSGQVLIKGTANDANFLNYKLEYGQGSSPATWSLISQSSQPVTDGTLATWQTRGLTNNGTYTLRLTAEDKAGNITTAKITVNLDNIKITNISVNPSSFNPLNSKTVTISYTTDRNANITIKIYDLNNNLVRTLVNSALRYQGNNSEIWNGKNDSDKLVSRGGYTITILAQAGNAEGWYQSSGGFVYNGVIATDFYFTPNFNPYNNELCRIEYTLPENALLLLQAGKDESSTYVSVIDWEVQVKGHHIEYWNGRDRNGDILNYYTENHPIIVGYRTQSLPENSIVVTAAEAASADVLSDPYCFMPAFGEFSEISYTILSSGSVSVTICKPSGEAVKTLLDNVSKAAGTYTLTWNGTDANGKVVNKDDNYIIKVDFTGSDGKATRYGNISTR